MKKKLVVLHILLLCLCFCSLFAQMQQQIDSLVINGIRHHDKGEYEEALEFYKKALELDPESDLVNYEIAYTCFEMKNYTEAINYAELALKANSKNAVMAGIVKGSSLNYLNETDNSIKTFKDAIAKFGDHYLLYYNLALVYHKQHEYEEESNALIKAISLKYNHASSHLQLAYCKNAMNKKAETLLNLYYFLFLEANSQRSKVAYELLQSIYNSSVQKDENKPGTFNIILDPNSFESEYQGIEIMIPMLQALKTTEINEGKSEEEFFMETTRSLFSLFGEHKTENSKGLWWNFYTPFFYELVKSGHIETFCYYISIGSNAKASEWMNKNSQKLESFSNWLNLNKTTFGMY